MMTCLISSYEIAIIGPWSEIGGGSVPVFVPSLVDCVPGLCLISVTGDMFTFDGRSSVCRPRKRMLHPVCLGCRWEIKQLVPTFDAAVNVADGFQGG